MPALYRPQTEGEYYPNEASAIFIAGIKDGFLTWLPVPIVQGGTTTEDSLRLSTLENTVATVDTSLAATVATLDEIKMNTLRHAGVDNTSRKVWQDVSGYVYEAWANPSASENDLKILLSNVASAPGVWNLQGTGVPRPYNSAMAHLYTNFTKVYVETTNSRRYFELLPNSTLIQRQTNPTDPLGDTSAWQQKDLTQLAQATQTVYNVNQPVISGTGYEGRTLTRTVGTWSTDQPITGQWYANGAATGATGSTYVVPVGQHGYTFTFREVSGGVTAVSNVIQNWIPNGLNPVFWYEGRDPNIVLSGSDMVSWPNKGAHQSSLVVGSGRTAPTVAGGIVTSSADTDYDDLSGSTTIAEVYFLAGYKDGIDNTFDDNTTVAYGTKRILGNTGGAGLFTGTNFATAAVFKNGAAASTTTVLPLPAMTLMRFVYTTPSNTIGLMAGGQAGRGWDGPIGALIGLGATADQGNREKIEGYMMWSNFQEAKIVSGHTYKNSAPV